MVHTSLHATDTALRPPEGEGRRSQSAGPFPSNRLRDEVETWPTSSHQPVQERRQRGSTGLTPQSVQVGRAFAPIGVVGPLFSVVWSPRRDLAPDRSADGADMFAEARRRRHPVIPGVLVFLASEALVDRHAIKAEGVVLAGNVQCADPRPIAPRFEPRGLRIVTLGT